MGDPRPTTNDSLAAGPTLPVAQVVAATEAEGPGKRFAVWFQGCPLRCPSCCNPEMLAFTDGPRTAVDALLEQTRHAAQRHGVEGVTLLGGEPTAHLPGAARYAEGVQRLGLSVMVFSGYTIEELRARNDREIDALLSATDLLIDGPYRKELPESGRRWIGSANQRIHFLSSRYQADDPCWQAPNTLELRIENGELKVNGFPAGQAVDLWKGRKGGRA